MIALAYLFDATATVMIFLISTALGKMPVIIDPSNYLQTYLISIFATTISMRFLGISYTTGKMVMYNLCGETHQMLLLLIKIYVNLYIDISIRIFMHHNIEIFMPSLPNIHTQMLPCARYLCIDYMVESNRIFIPNYPHSTVNIIYGNLRNIMILLIMFANIIDMRLCIANGLSHLIAILCTFSKFLTELFHAKLGIGLDLCCMCMKMENFDVEVAAIYLILDILHLLPPITIE